MLKYELHVEGIEIDGHPLISYSNSLDNISHLYDSYVKMYPYNRITLNEYIVKELKRSEVKTKPLPNCPRGCSTKQIDGKTSIGIGSNGKAYCKICIWREED